MSTQLKFFSFEVEISVKMFAFNPSTDCKPSK